MSTATMETITPRVWEEICGRRAQIKALEQKVDKTKEDLKAAKDLLDCAYSELGELIDQQTADPGPLFNGANDDGGQAEGAEAVVRSRRADVRAVIDVPQLPFDSSAAGGDAGQENAEAAGQAAEAQRIEVGGKDWKRVNISTLKLPGRIHAALSDAGLTTIGKIAKLSADGGLLTDVKGIGEAAATTIEDAMTVFWRLRKEAGFEDEG